MPAAATKAATIHFTLLTAVIVIESHSHTLPFATLIRRGYATDGYASATSLRHIDYYALLPHYRYHG